jgi:hypothetical protein
MIKNSYWFSCEVPVILTTFERNLNILDRYSKNKPISNFMKIRSVGAELFHADMRTEITNITATFRNFANAPN